MAGPSEIDDLFRTGLAEIDQHLIPDGMPRYSRNVIGGAYRPKH